MKAVYAILAAALLASCATTPAMSPPAAVPTIKGVRHIGITVSDIDATLAFYQPNIPYELIYRSIVPASAFPRGTGAGNGPVEVALVRTPTVFIQLMDFEPDSAAAPAMLPVIGPGYTHVCFQSPSTNSIYAKFRSGGLAMVSRGDRPIDIGGYGVTYAYGRDPDGTMIEIEMIDAPRRSEAAWVRHIATVTPDIDKMLAFYTAIVGYGPHRRITTGNNPRLDDIADIDGLALQGGWIATRNLELEFWQYTSPVTPPPSGDRPLATLGHSLIAFEVTDLATEIARLRSLGVRLVGRPTVMGGWRVQYARDPDGNLFAMQQNVVAGTSESIDGMLWQDPASLMPRTN
jgi:catechol 2,3-dioxygenase-like lactoylglutathione lyase family enzyme